MATYTPTITTNARAEKGLDLELREENARRAAESPPLPPYTKAQLIDSKITLMLKAYGDAYVSEVRRLVGAATETATVSQLANAVSALGVVLP